VAETLLALGSQIPDPALLNEAKTIYAELQSTARVGVVLLAEGDFHAVREGGAAEALASYDAALVVFRGEDCFEVVPALHKLVILHARREDYRTAISCGGEALKARRSHSSRSGPSLVDVLLDVGGILLQVGKGEEALELYREAHKCLLESNNNYLDLARV